MPPYNGIFGKYRRLQEQSSDTADSTTTTGS
jgi:hypothetical protein